MREIFKSLLVTGAVVSAFALLAYAWWIYSHWAWERGLAEETVAGVIFLLLWWIVHGIRQERGRDEW